MKNKSNKKRNNTRLCFVFGTEHTVMGRPLIAESSNIISFNLLLWGLNYVYFMTFNQSVTEKPVFLCHLNNKMSVKWFLDFWNIICLTLTTNFPKLQRATGKKMSLL